VWRWARLFAKHKVFVLFVDFGTTFSSRVRSLRQLLDVFEFEFVGAGFEIS
jgi:hypothetical protein